jgi:hypothetical protein
LTWCCFSQSDRRSITNANCKRYPRTSELEAVWSRQLIGDCVCCIFLSVSETMPMSDTQNTWVQSSRSPSQTGKRTTNRNEKLSPLNAWNETSNGLLFPDDPELEYCHRGRVLRLALTSDKLLVTMGRPLWRLCLTDFGPDRWKTTMKKIRVSTLWVFGNCDGMPSVFVSMECKPKPWTELRDQVANPQVKPSISPAQTFDFPPFTILTASKLLDRRISWELQFSLMHLNSHSILHRSW